MKKTLINGLLVLTVASLTACSTVTKEQGGAVAGAAIGGVVGNQIGGGSGNDIATVLGVIFGAIAGASVGKTFDQLDAANTQRALETYRSNQTSSWVNPDSGNQYTVTPTNTFQNSSNQYCREFQTTVTVGGELHKGYGTACRQPDGQWKVVQ